MKSFPLKSFNHFPKPVPKEVEAKAQNMFMAASIEWYGHARQWEKVPMQTRNYWRIQALIEENKRLKNVA